MNGMFNAMFYIIPILGIAIFAFACIMMFSAKARGKLMSKQMKAMRYMMEESQEDLSTIVSTTNKAASHGIHESREELKMMGDDLAYASEDAIETTVRAVKKGITEEEPVVFCKHCGKPIDEDSKYCRHCGKEQ